MTSGGRFPSPSAVIFAPISVSGSMTRAIGRRESEASPMSRLRNGWPASTPASRRMVVPELPQSMSPFGAVKTRLRPCTTTVTPLPPSAGSAVSIWMPSARSADIVQRQSSLGRKPVITQGPL